jgi:hypothetical protein
VIGPVENRLFCSMAKKFKQNKKSKEKQATIYKKKIKIIMDETDLPTFNAMINNNLLITLKH